MRKLLILTVFSMFVLSLFASAVFAQPSLPPATGGEGEVTWVVDTIKWCIGAIQSKNWTALFGTILMLTVFVVGRFVLPKIDTSKLPWVATLLAMLLEFGLKLASFALGATAQDWLGAVVSALVTGAAAMGFWSLFGKWIMGKLFPPKTGSKEPSDK